MRPVKFLLGFSEPKGLILVNSRRVCALDGQNLGRTWAELGQNLGRTLAQGRVLFYSEIIKK